MKKLVLIVALLASALAASAQRNTSQSYIEKFKDNAIRIMHETGVPASIILAVAMHESANGNSNIAKKLNNQFGVKGYDAHTYTYDNKKVRTYYKKYTSVMESFQDFARIMTERAEFSGLASRFTHFDYAGWAKGIQRNGYCSSHTWSRQVMDIIRKYQLYNLDENPADKENTGVGPQMAQNQ